jgi:hypothetical protein
MNKKFIVPTTLALAGAMVLSGCGETEEPTTTPPPTPPVETPAPPTQTPPVMDDDIIEAKAMMNATYTIEGEEVTLVNGKAEVEAAPGSASKNVYMMQAGETEDGDLNGDGKEDDGAGVMVMSGAGSGTFYYAVAYVDGEGTNGVLIGDRINIDDISIENGVIEVEYLDRAEGAAMADAPTVEKKMMLTVTNGVLAEKK